MFSIETVCLDYRFDVKSQERLHSCLVSATDARLCFCRQTCAGRVSQRTVCVLMLTT